LRRLSARLQVSSKAQQSSNTAIVSTVRFFGKKSVVRAGDIDMTRIDSALDSAPPAGSAFGGRMDLAQLGTIPNKGNVDQGVSAVQGRGPDGKVYGGQLIQRVYGTGYVRFYLKGTGDSHPLPARITSSDEAKVFARQQIRKGVWKDLPPGDQNAFRPPPANNVDQGTSDVQGRRRDGKVYTGQLVQRTYGTGEVRFYFKGTGDSHPLPTGITTAEEAKVFARQQISKGVWNDFPLGDQNAFIPQVRVDLGDPHSEILFGIKGPPKNEVARNRARDAGLRLDKDERTLRIPNTLEGGRIFAQLQFQTSGVNDSCKDDCRVVGMANGPLPMPAQVSAEFIKGFKAAARRPNAD
jgi:hypothetical protein